MYIGGPGARKLLVGWIAAAAIIGASPAIAADAGVYVLPQNALPPGPPPPPPPPRPYYVPPPKAFRLTGCYAGANVGWVGGQDDFNLAPSPLQVSHYDNKSKTT